MRSTRTQLACGAILWLMAGAALWPSGAARGQTAPVLSGQPAAAKPGVTVERQGRLLVLNYGAAGADYRADTRSASTSPPEFTVYKGKKKIASGQFEYG
jgi:hypothetical protein